MSWTSRLTLFLAAAFIAGIFGWALLAPKEDISQRINRTIKEQSGQADLAFKGVAFEEIDNGVKYWQLNANNASVNKSTGLATLQTANGIFFKKGKASLRFLSPAALWDMKKKEIYLDKPFGYDTSLEKKIAALRRSLAAGGGSTFTLPKISSKERGYWFQASNLSWKLEDQQLLCTGGIVLNKGEVTGYAEKLSGDVGLEKVRLEGSPRVVILPAGMTPITLEANAFEVISATDLIVANGSPAIFWEEAKITADTLQYQQTKQQLEMTGNVVISYKDIQAWGQAAQYLTGRNEIILQGDARAVQGGNRLNGNKVVVSLKDQRVAVMGKGKVTITE
jgi:lipopolysaccharide transport protein LptA